MYFKRLKLFLIISTWLFTFCQNSNAASVIYPLSGKIEYNEITGGDYLKASVFVNLSAREFASLTGQELNFLQRLYFKSFQRKLMTYFLITQ